MVLDPRKGTGDLIVHDYMRAHTCSHEGEYQIQQSVRVFFSEGHSMHISRDDILHDLQKK